MVRVDMGVIVMKGSLHFPDHLNWNLTIICSLESYQWRVEHTVSIFYVWLTGENWCRNEPRRRKTEFTSTILGLKLSVAEGLGKYVQLWINDTNNSNHQLLGGVPCDEVADMLDCDIIISKYEL